MRADRPLRKGDFVCEYAKSGRSKCHGTGELIPKDELRIGIMGESPCSLMVT